MPVKVALIGASVQSLIGQEAIRFIERLGLTRCSLVDLRDAFVMTPEECAYIADPKNPHLKAQRIVLRHSDFVGVVCACVADSVHGGDADVRIHFRVDEQGGIADQVCRAEAEALNDIDGP